MYWLSIATVLHMREFMLEAKFQSTFSKEQASTRRTPAQYAFVQPDTLYSAGHCSIGRRLGHTVIFTGGRVNGLATVGAEKSQKRRKSR